MTVIENGKERPMRYDDLDLNSKINLKGVIADPKREFPNRGRDEQMVHLIENGYKPILILWDFRRAVNCFFDDEQKNYLPLTPQL